MIRSRLGAQRQSVDGKIDRRNFVDPQIIEGFDWLQRRRTKHGGGISPEDIPISTAEPQLIENVFFPTKRIISPTKNLVGGFHASGIDTASSKLARAQRQLKQSPQTHPHFK